MRAFTIRTVLFLVLCFMLISPTVAGAEEPATPVAATEVPSTTPPATTAASTPVAIEPVATEEPIVAASEPITLTLNGVPNAAFVKVGSTVTVAVSPSDMWIMTYAGSGCQGPHINFIKTLPWGYTVNEPFIGSVLAWNPHLAYSRPIEGTCLDVTWGAPTLLLDGNPRDAYLSLNAELTAETSPAYMKINIYGGSGCQAQRLITVANSGYKVKEPEAGTASLQAFDPADPSNVSPCLDASWDSYTPPTQPVELLLNGKQESITVFNNHQISMETSPANLSLRIYDGLRCVGRPVVHQATYTQVNTTATTQSVQAVDPNHPANPSECLNSVWRTPGITLAVDSWYGDGRSYYPSVPYQVRYWSEDSGVTILGRLYLNPECGSFPRQTTVIELPVATQKMFIEQLFSDNPSQWGGWSMEAYDPKTGQVSQCQDIAKGKIGETPPATPDAPVTAEPSGPTDSTSTPTTGAVTTLPNTGDGPTDTQSATSMLLAVSMLLGTVFGILSLMRIRQRRS